jgi:predicted outer membrane repeat protein
LTLIDCTFTTNTALDDGGGACSAEHSSPTVTGCTFAENQAQSGGGLQIESWHPPGATVAHCTFVSNIAETDGGGFVLSWTPAVITDCVFSGNVAGDKGGGLYSLAPLNFTTVSNSGFFGNQAAEGGGWHNGFGSPRITNCTFHANSAASFGGGMFNVYFFNNSVTNCVFTENAAAIGGAGVFNLGSWPMYVNCTFTGNEATVEGGAMKSEALNSDTPSLLLLTNCIVWGDSPDEFEQDTASETTVLFSDVQGGWPGPGNVDADPMFTDPISDYRLQSGSPCIDAGHNNAIAGLADTDFDGNPRFADDPATDDTGCGIPVVVDMGAYEYQGEPADVTFADLDGDGVVRIADLLILTGCLGSDDPQCCTADLDLDGMVGMSDRWLLLDMLIQSIPDP